MNHDIREALHNLLSVMEMQEKRQSGEFHISGETFMGMWSDAKHNARQALAALEREEYRCERCQQPMRFNVPRLGPNGGFVHSDTGSLDCATPPAAEREGADADEEGTYKIGYRDGYEDAVQDIDVLTGGDGEYRYCTDHDPDRHTPDAAAMKRRIEERFDALQAAQPAQQDEARWRNEMDALMVAMQRASEALFAATRDGQKIETAVQYEQLAVALYTLNAAIDKQRGAGEA